jgi:membrane fusion protein, heavy metal efflux system
MRTVRAYVPASTPEGFFMKRAFAATLAILTLLLAAGTLPAHEGHDHGDRTPQPARILPRGEALTEAFELVAVAEGNQLAIYLDRFTTNEPVGRAEIEVETPTGPVAATAQADNVFRLAAPWLAKAGKYDLIFTVTADGTVDVLSISLEIPEPLAATVSARTGMAQFAFLFGAAALGFLLALMVMPKRRSRGSAAAVPMAALPQQRLPASISPSACPTAACSFRSRPSASWRSKP